jgi:selenocysteine lyase/cysteine desulfurase
LRDYWVERVRKVPRIEILTPDDLSSHAGITSFRLKGVPADVVQRTLVDTHRVLTAARTGIAAGDAVRVTPALYMLEADLNRLAGALRNW